VDVRVGQPYGHGEVVLPVVVVRGRKPGPHLFVSAAIHGDEINGVEIIRRLLHTVSNRRLNGALIAVPIVNVYGFMAQSRYLPDRRDLNRSFPGSARGSLASRLASVFMGKIVAVATHGIDLHTGSLHRSNLPQIRACLDKPDTERLARAFGAPVIINANLRDGSLRQAVLEREIPMLLYEAGEALRFDEIAIRAGVRGVLSVMQTLGMLPAGRRRAPPPEPLIARATTWIRAPEGGIFLARTQIGARVKDGDLLAEISDPLGEDAVRVEATSSGIVIARTMLPLVNEGDALFHVAQFDRPGAAARRVETFQAELDPDEVESPSGQPPIV
jgi:predicted deacylase